MLVHGLVNTRCESSSQNISLGSLLVHLVLLMFLGYFGFCTSFTVTIPDRTLRCRAGRRFALFLLSVAVMAVGILTRQAPPTLSRTFWIDFKNCSRFVSPHSEHFVVFIALHVGHFHGVLVSLSVHTADFVWRHRSCPHFSLAHAGHTQASHSHKDPLPGTVCGFYFRTREHGVGGPNGFAV